MFSKATDLSSLSIMEQNLYIAAKNCYPWVLENPNHSPIELEIIQAAFLNESQFQYFYFRTGTMLLKPMDKEKEEMLSAGFLFNDEEKLKIGKLKAKIISKGLPVRLYRDLCDLGEPGSQGLVGCDRKTLPSHFNHGKYRLVNMEIAMSVVIGPCVLYVFLVKGIFKWLKIFLEHLKLLPYSCNMHFFI